MDDFKEHLRRLAVHDDALVEVIVSEEETLLASALGEKTAALVRVAATIAVDAAPSTFQHAVSAALAAGASYDEIVATLEAVTPVTGTARVVAVRPEARARARLRRRGSAGAARSVRPRRNHAIRMRNAGGSASIVPGAR